MTGRAKLRVALVGAGDIARYYLAAGHLSRVRGLPRTSWFAWIFPSSTSPPLVAPAPADGNPAASTSTPPAPAAAHHPLSRARARGRAPEEAECASTT